MSNDNKKMVKEITSMDADFAQWYTDIVKKADLAAYSNVKGFMIVRPYGYAIWELMQSNIDQMFKALGHENICMPMLIPESLLNKEKEHVEGFAPEVAWVTYGGSEKLEERYCIRPTSETLFCDHFKDIVHSWRDLPLLYNQWVSVVRWEKTTRPFLRTREFLWQEGHTLHATQEEAEQTFSLEIGDACDDGYYARISGSNMVYTIPKAAAEALIFTTYADLKPEDVLLMDWDKVSSVDIVLDEETYTIRISSTTSTDEDGNEVQEVTYTLDGEEIDGDSILNALDDLDSTGYASGSPGENPEEIRFVIHQDHQTFPEVELVFYRYNSTSCMVTLNGEPTVLVNREDVVSLVETVNDQVL